MGAIVAVVIIVILLLLLMGPGEKTPFTAEMTSTNSMNVNLKGEFTGDDAKMIRSLIEDGCGNGDGQVSDSEVTCFEQHAPDYLGDVIEIDGESGDTSQMNIGLTGANGNVNSASAISATFAGTINWPGIDTNKLTYNIYFDLDPFVGQDFRFVAPSGYEIMDVSGLSGVSYGAGKTTVTGTIADEDVNIMIIKTGSGVSPENEPNNNFVSANPISDGAIVTGHLDQSTDMDDFFSITLQAGDTIDITLSGRGSSDFDLELYDSSENDVDGSYRGESDEQISYSVTSSGTYYVRVYSYHGSGGYTLSVDVH